MVYVLRVKIDGSCRPAPQHFIAFFAPTTLTLTTLSVVEQDVTGAKSLGYNALGQDLGHQLVVLLG